MLQNFVRKALKNNYWLMQLVSSHGLHELAQVEDGYEIFKTQLTLNEKRITTPCNDTQQPLIYSTECITRHVIQDSSSETRRAN